MKIINLSHHFIWFLSIVRSVYVNNFLQRIRFISSSYTCHPNTCLHVDIPYCDRFSTFQNETDSFPPSYLIQAFSCIVTPPISPHLSHCTSTLIPDSGLFMHCYSSHQKSNLFHYRHCTSLLPRLDVKREDILLQLNKFSQKNPRQKSTREEHLESPDDVSASRIKVLV